MALADSAKRCMHVSRFGMSCAEKAITLRKSPSDLLAHGDWDSQYASSAYRNLLLKNKLIASMSRTRHDWDNTVIERFFLNLNMECVWQKSYGNHGEAKAILPTTSSTSTTHKDCIRRWATLAGCLRTGLCLISLIWASKTLDYDKV